ncbi:MAG: GGDEF domain-containing protein [Gammaproteobacteria bacterium]|nr:GGDEF domain-containing protein [Gammaproteobacteria bacterium]
MARGANILNFSIDVPTLVFITGILSVVAAVMLTANWQMNKHVRGTREWALMQWLWAIGLLLYLPRGIWSDWLSIILANMLIVVGSFILLRGFSKYQGIKSTPVLIELIGVILLLLGYYYWTVLKPDIQLRVVMLSFFSFVIMLRAFIILWPLFKTKSGIAAVVGVGISFHGLFFLSRVFLTISDDPTDSLLSGAAGSVWMLTEAIIFIFWSTISFALMTNLKLQKDLQSLADRDPLTNLLNRRAIFAECQQSIKAGDISSVSVLVLDLDKFKSINDQFGHLVGDKVLIHFAQLVSRAVPKSSMLGRTGGEEFIVVLPNSDKLEAEAIAANICSKTRDALILVDDKNIQFTVSIGIAYGSITLPTDLRQIINNADKAMYKAKNKGRDCYQEHTESSNLSSV